MEGYQYLTDPDGPFTPLVLASPLSPCSPFDGFFNTTLPAWNQVAQRAYIQVALCFPFDGEETAAVTHIEKSLQRLGKQCRDFAGALRADPRGERVRLEKHHDDEITFEVVDLGDKFPYTFAQLKSKDFAPSAFVNPDIALDGTLDPVRLLPVCQVRVSFIQGGMILWVSLHHSFTDGDGLRAFLECFSAQTRGTEAAHPGDIILEPSNNSPTLSPSSSSNLEELLKDCPEYVKAPVPQRCSTATVDTPLAPLAHFASTVTSVPSTSQVLNKGNMFVFRQDRLDLLKSLIEAIQPAGRKKRPSSYVALATLTWAHLLKARTEAEAAPAGANPSDPARLTNCVNWKSRAIGEAPKGYLGVGVALPFTQLPAEEVTRACHDFNAVLPLIRAVEETIGSVDDKFVAQRSMALAAAVAENARSIMLDFDYLNPKHIAFNTWRHMGMDTEWEIPGVTSAKPAAIRPLRDVVRMGYALILPGRKDSDVHEVIITAAPETMERLMQDHDYMRWVDRVVE